jgi:Ca2+-transporting ATPase
MIVGLASLANAPLPIRPLQILYLNLVTDVFPALALGVGEGDASIMKHPPRDPKEPVLTRRHWGIIGGYSLLITISTLTAFGLSLFWLEMELQNAVTITFLSLASAQLWHVFNMRTHESPLLLNEVTRNPAIWLALLICIGLLVAAVYLPGLSDLLGTVHPSPVGWALAVGLGFFPLIVGQTLKVLGVGRTGSTA